MKSDFQLGNYHVCPQHDKVTYDNEVYKLEPKIMEVLCLLVHCRGEVLSRKEIANRLWPDSVVGLEVVTRAIFELRKVFNDDSKNPQYIETIAKKGYVFIATIDQEKKKLNKVKSKSNKSLFFICTVLIALSVVLVLTLTESTNKQHKAVTNDVVPNYQVSVLSDGQGDIQSAVISKDSSQLIYIQKDQDSANVQLILKNINNHQQTVLLALEQQELRSVITSPNDDRTVYFIRCSSARCEIIKQDVDSSAFEIIYQSTAQLKGISIAPNGKKLAIVLILNGHLKLATLELEGEVKELVHLETSGASYLAKFSQNGTELYFVNNEVKRQTSIQRYNLNSHQSSVVSVKFSRITSLHRESDSSLLVAGKTQGLYAIWRINLLNDEITQVRSMPPSTHAYSLTNKFKSQELFYIQRSSNLDIGSKGLPSNINLSDLNSHANDFNGVWSTKQQALFFISQRTGNYELWRYENATNRKLTDISADSIKRPILNYQQTKIAFIALIDNQLKLVIHDIAKNQSVISQNIDELSYLLSWSRDNESIYLSIKSDNIYDIWQLNLESALSKRILLGAGLIAEENIRDNSIIFADLTSKKVVKKTQQGDIFVIKDFVDIPLVVHPHSVKINDEKIYYVRNKPAANEVISEPLYSHQPNTSPQQLFTLEKNSYVTDLGIDKQAYVIYDYTSSKSSKMMLVEAVRE
ncbi:MAG: winged helix-turn-helix domain-containing protein [Colwellia sp.]|nr:winged helix-turn-helix domain-containing protein [Colwellia sp.]